MKRRALMPAVLALIVVFPVVARASVVLIEEPIDGYIGPIPGIDITAFYGEGIGVGNIGSDGVDPFNLGVGAASISDFIELGSSWLPITPGTGAFANGFWTWFDNRYWVLPEVTTPGSGSEPPYEPVAKWYLPGQSWSTSQETFILVHPDGTISDIITLDNTGPGPNGWAAITFASDPVPEPATLVLWSGLGAMGLVSAWRRRKRTA